MALPRVTPCLAPTLALAAALAAALAVAGCASAVVGAGAVTGVAAVQERGLEQAARDTRLEAEILAEWLRGNDALVPRVGVEVYEGRVLLTGIVAAEEMRADAVRLAWKVAGVKEVINEIGLAPATGVVDLARDAWITTQLKARLTLDKEVLAINYAVETVNGVVYLIGIAQSPAELARVIDHARALAYVRDVISHVRVKGAA